MMEEKQEGGIFPPQGEDRVKSQISVLKIFQNEEKWLINVSQEPDMINTTLDNGRSLKQLIIGVSLFLAFQAIRES